MSIQSIAVKNQIESCLLCHDAKCSQACPRELDPASMIRSLRFNNEYGFDATKYCACADCASNACVESCIKAHIDVPLNIPAIAEYTANIYGKNLFEPEVDLSTTFCGVKCENMFFLSSSVVASNYDMVARAFDMGWAGAAFKTIGTFVPEEVSPRFATINKEGNSFIGFKNIEQISDYTLADNIAFIKKLKKDYPTKVIIASILGQDDDEWTYLAKEMTDAGADIIECNFSCPHMSKEGLGSDVGQDPELVAQFTKAARRGTDLPILAKMTPNIGNMELPAIAAIEAGADGIAAINTIKSIMGINFEDFGSEPYVDGKSSVGGYSGKTVKPIALRFIHDMKKNEILEGVPISGMGGIESWRDAMEFISLGCANLQITTSVMQYGYRIIDDLISGLSGYMVKNDYSSVDELIGKALPHLIDANDLNRSSRVYPVINKEKCIGCGRCYLSCMDGGHQAIDFTDGKPKVNGRKCVGCHLCSLVCPVGAITRSKRVEI